MPAGVRDTLSDKPASDLPSLMLMSPPLVTDTLSNNLRVNLKAGGSE
jgi:hypothetical protein